MTMRIKVSHPLTFNGVLRAVGAIIDVDDNFGKRAISAGMARLATAEAIKPVALDPGLDLAISQRLGAARMAARLSLPDSRLGPVAPAEDVPVVTLNAVADASYNKVYNVTGTGAGVAGKFRDFGDVGEGLDFDYNVTWLVNFSGYQQTPRSLRFMTDANKVCLALASTAPLYNQGFVLYVNGRPVNATGSGFVPGTAQTVGLHTLVFPTAKPRLIEVRASTYFAAVYLPAPYNIWKPPARRGPRTLIIGDSYTFNSNVTDNIMNAAYWNIGPHIGSDDVWLDPYGGTGYTVGHVADGSGGTSFFNRVDANIALLSQTWNIEAINPELVVVHGGGANDIFKGKTDAQIIAGVVATFQRLRARLPNAKLVFVEGFAPPGFTPATYNPRFKAIREGAQAALTATGVYYIDVATTRPWIRGAGTIAAPNADAENANVYITGDTFHPNGPGHLYIRHRMGTALRRVLADDGARLNSLIQPWAA